MFVSSESLWLGACRPLPRIGFGILWLRDGKLNISINFHSGTTEEEEESPAHSLVHWAPGKTCACLQISVALRDKLNSCNLEGNSHSIRPSPWSLPTGDLLPAEMHLTASGCIQGGEHDRTYSERPWSLHPKEPPPLHCILIVSHALFDFSFLSPSLHQDLEDGGVVLVPGSRVYTERHPIKNKEASFVISKKPNVSLGCCMLF